MTSAELITALQAARPVANDALRDRVRAIAAAEPVQRPSPFARLSRISLRRFALVAVPATAVVLLGTAGVVGLLDSGSRAAGRELGRARELAPSDGARPERRRDDRAAAQGRRASRAADAATPAPTTGRATALLGPADPRREGRRRRSPMRRRRRCRSRVTSVATSSRSRTPPPTPGVSSLTLKVPTANVQDALVRLTGLGKIVSQQVQIDDLQGQVDELTKRETALRGQIARLSARLAGTDLDAETRATLEARRDAARAELARVRTTRAQVNAEARYATIQLTLQTSQSRRRPGDAVTLGRRRRPRRRDPRRRGDGRPLRRS